MSSRDADRAVLVVDDEIALREMLSEVLQDEGYQPVEASNGAEAIQRLQQMPQHFCLILLDMMMPIMNGVQFRLAQKGDPALDAIPVIAMSADPGQLNKIRQLDVADGLPKPFDFDKLLGLLDRYCC